MMKIKILALVVLTAAIGAPFVAAADSTTYTENFTGAATNNSWYFFNGACLTAGSSTATTTPGIIPTCVGYPYYNGITLLGGYTGTLPDTPAQGGALRFTQDYNENGAILSAFSFPLSSQGMQVTFTTETYMGNSGGAGGDGADGISFFLQDAKQSADVGAFGGSLGYSCSNTNYSATLRANGQPRGYDGLAGGYIGLGIDEYGNFLNQGDNTSTGYGYVPNRIGLRGAGSTSWSFLNGWKPLLYPSYLTNAQRAEAVRQTCQTGLAWDFSVPLLPLPTLLTVPNYGVIPNAFKVLTNVKIANESATMRGYGITDPAYGVPITYTLSITTAGLLSLAYSYNGGANQPVITNQDIQASNGALPAAVRFGFAGSTGGSDNIHEIMCFQAAPQNTTQTSAGLSQKQSSKLQTGTQVYLANYNPTSWSGSVTSQYLVVSQTDANLLEVSSTVNWDASCVLTGIATGASCATTGATGPKPAEAPASRVILSWNGSKGIPFQWASLSSSEQAALDAGDATLTPNRLNYLRGDRSNEITSMGIGLYRDRLSVLGDIIDSSPTWVGPPSNSYTTPWADALYTGASMPENSGQTYAAYTTAQKTRTNVVYAGANDGMLHGFRTGSFSAAGTYSGTYNDGYEIMAYVPGYVVNHINISANPSLNYSNAQYGHRFEVDAQPAAGDLYYAGAWHTWLVGGLGPGGAAIYALDVTKPGTGSTNGFSEAAAATTVIGEWSTTPLGTTLTCATDSGANKCGVNLGDTFGTPELHRFHNGTWGAVFGNGFGSATGDAGIYVMLVNATTGAQTFYYLSTGTSGSGNGIAYTTASDLDGDSVVDYIYAGDLLGNVWRFDLTDVTPGNWAVRSNPVFTTLAGQPITTKLMVIAVSSSPTSRVMIEFGTGQQTPLTNTSAATYKTTQQYLYGIWDWDLASWNTKSSTQYAALPRGAIAKPTQPAPPAAAISGTAYLQAQSITGSFSSSSSSAAGAYRTISSSMVCYADTVGCTRYGWYLPLSYGHANPLDGNAPDPSSYPGNSIVYEQTIYNPTLALGAFVVNTAIPAVSSLATCSSTSAGGWTMAINPATGGAFLSTNTFFVNPNSTTTAVNSNLTVTDAGGNVQAVSGVATGSTGSTSVVSVGGTSGYNLVAGSPTGAKVFKIKNVSLIGGRVTWTQKR